MKDSTEPSHEPVSDAECFVCGATAGGVKIEVLDKLTEFLRKHSDYLLVALVPGIKHLGKTTDNGWDIVLRLDGTYFDREMAEGVRDSFAKELGINTPSIPPEAP